MDDHYPESRGRSELPRRDFDVFTTDEAPDAEGWTDHQGQYWNGVAI
jgi:hypothetical protein